MDQELTMEIVNVTPVSRIEGIRVYADYGWTEDGKQHVAKETFSVIGWVTVNVTWPTGESECRIDPMFIDEGHTTYATKYRQDSERCDWVAFRTIVPE